MKRITVLVVLTLLIAGVFTGVGLAKTHITFWHAMSGPHGAVLEALIEEFNAQSTTVHVEGIYQGRYSEVETKVMASIAAQNPPTIAQVYENFTANLLVNDAVAPFENYLGLSKEELQDFVTVFREMNSWNGMMYSVPFNKSTSVMYYNTDLLPTPPATLEEFLAEAQRISTETKFETMGFGIRPTVELFDIFLRLHGGQMLTEDNEVAFNSQAGHEALALMKKMVDDKLALMVDGFESGPFGAGMIAMYFGSSAGAPHVAAAARGNVNWSMAPIPEGKLGAAPFMGANIALLARTTEEQRKAAAEFVLWLTNAKNTAHWSAAAGYLPVRYSGLEHPIWKEYVAENPGVAEGPANPRQFENGFWQPRIGEWTTGRPIITTLAEEVLFGANTVEGALGNAVSTWEREMRRRR